MASDEELRDQLDTTAELRERVRQLERERDEAREKEQEWREQVADTLRQCAHIVEKVEQAGKAKVAELKALCLGQADVLESLEYKCMGCREDVEEVVKRLREAGK
jgi:uncharacterized coiled-coil DUF342 family protein